MFSGLFEVFTDLSWNLSDVISFNMKHNLSQFTQVNIALKHSPLK
jgi:hypothetical protein